MFRCVRCAVPAEIGRDGWVLCHECREQQIAAEERRERKARIVGAQPLVCEGCGRPYLARSPDLASLLLAGLPAASLAGPDR
jgi:hypothetical protein